MITVARENDKMLRVNVIPKKLRGGTKTRL
jgi:hypothetical protein